jgi:hypothetical protein
MGKALSSVPTTEKKKEKIEKKDKKKKKQGNCALYLDQLGQDPGLPIPSLHCHLTTALASWGTASSQALDTGH